MTPLFQGLFDYWKHKTRLVWNKSYWNKNFEPGDLTTNCLKFVLASALPPHEFIEISWSVNSLHFYSSMTRSFVCGHRARWLAKGLPSSSSFRVDRNVRLLLLFCGSYVTLVGGRITFMIQDLFHFYSLSIVHSYDLYHIHFTSFQNTFNQLWELLKDSGSWRHSTLTYSWISLSLDALWLPTKVKVRNE